MYPASTGAGKTPDQRPGSPRGGRQPHAKRSRKGSSHKGFLIILLILLVCAAAAAVVFLWYLPNRDSDGLDPDLEARNLVRQAMLAIDGAYAEAGTYEPQTMDPKTLSSFAPEVTFSPMSDTSAATAPIAMAKDKTVNYAGTQTSYAVGTISENGTAYGVLVENQGTAAVTYYVDGRPVEQWEQATPTTASTDTPAGTDTETAPTQTTEVITGTSGTAKDLEAMTLVRDSMTTVESAYASIYASLGTFEASELTASLLQEMAPSITFVLRDSDQAATDPVSLAAAKSIDFYGTETGYALGVKSESGTTFGVIVDKSSSGQTTFYVNGQPDDWSARLPAPVVGSLTRFWG